MKKIIIILIILVVFIGAILAIVNYTKKKQVQTGTRTNFSDIKPQPIPEQIVRGKA